MPSRGLSHKEIRIVLEVFAETGEFVVPEHALVSQRQKLDLITAILPQVLLRHYDFFFRFFDDLTVDIGNQSPENLEKEKQEVVNYLSATKILKAFGDIREDEQELLAHSVVENLVRLA